MPEPPPAAARSLRVTLTQLPSSRDLAGNLAAALSVIDAAGAAGSDLILLPENCLFCGTNAEMRDAAFSLDSPEIEAVATRARQWRTPIVLGGFKHRTSDGKIYNTACVFGPDGSPAARYDKIHLFNASVGGVRYQASLVEQPGAEPAILLLAGAAFGLTICYDLRFPELYRNLALAGAEIFLVPSAFTRVTGAAHWETLLRARAIENGGFVVASATIGGTPDGAPDPISTYGHALCVDPWGRVLADLGDASPGWQTIRLDLGLVASTRQSLPVLAQTNPAATAAPRTFLLPGRD